ncbi:MAG: helix-turn-helix domain-containing protein [bacterium]|nr:helix-turn-helix domain-containing protein [bacterium]
MRYDYFVPTRYQEFVQNCLRAIKNKEIVSIFFAPKTDRVWRIGQFIQDYKAEYPIAKLDLPAEEIEGIEDVEFQIEKQIGNAFKKNIAIFITNTEALIRSKNYTLLEEIVKFQNSKSNILFLFCFEQDITHPEIARHFYHTDIFSNIIYYALYNAQDTLSFINYLCSKWNFELTSIIKEKIIKECGGHFWFVKYATRMLRDNPRIDFQDIITSEQMHFRVEQITETFLDSEIKVLNKILLSKSITDSIEKHSLQFLTKMGFVKNDAISIPILAHHLRERLPKFVIEIIDTEILLNEVNVVSHFSRNEKKTLRVLLQNKNNIVSRDDIGKAIWPINTENEYSDWAVDRIIARLRSKLMKLGMPKEIIKTLRGKGYMLVN